MGKVVGVLFSGGLDSTYLVYKNLKEGNIVRPIYIEIENNYNKVILEKNRIEHLIKIFDEEFNNENNYYNRKIHPISHIIKTNVNASEDSIYLKQIPIWIVGLLYGQGLGVDEFQIGYVCGDDSTSYIQDMKDIYYSYEKISEKLIPIEFPLSKTKKREIFHELPEKYRKYIYTCECPDIVGNEKDELIEYHACCSCPACTTIIMSNYYDTEKFPKEYLRNLKRFYYYRVSGLGLKLVDTKTNKDYQVGSLFSSYDEPPIPKEGVQLELDFDVELKNNELLPKLLDSSNDIDDSSLIKTIRHG